MLANLKATLAARRVRQVDLALKLKLPPSALSEIVNERRMATQGLRDRIAEALRADAEWLFSPVAEIPPLIAKRPRLAQALATNELGGTE